MRILSNQKNGKTIVLMHETANLVPNSFSTEIQLYYINKTGGDFIVGETVRQSNGAANVAFGQVVSVVANGLTNGTLTVINKQISNTGVLGVFGNTGNTSNTIGITSSAYANVITITLVEKVNGLVLEKALWACNGTSFEVKRSGNVVLSCVNSGTLDLQGMGCAANDNSTSDVQVTASGTSGALYLVLKKETTFNSGY